MKRGRSSGGSVTGGTGDIKPQVLTGTIAAPAAADDYKVQQLNLPVPRFGTMKTKATVFELLEARWYINMVNNQDTACSDFAYMATQQIRDNDATSTLATFTGDMSDPVTFGGVIKSVAIATEGAIVIEQPYIVDFTDQNGNGMVIATDRIFLHYGGVGQAAVGDTIVKLKYRLINVGITEYVGIVQSQQG